MCPTNQDLEHSPMIGVYKEKCSGEECHEEFQVARDHKGRWMIPAHDILDKKNPPHSKPCPGAEQPPLGPVIRSGSYKV
jgi:hypothetical protein